jgi:glycosyltransferase involved in cell wall biosynthesis
MACGTPVVAGNAGALPEVLGDAAEFVDPATVSDLAEGMDRVLHDHDYAEDLVRRGQTVVEGYTWESTADAVLEALLSSSQTGTE